MSHIRAIAWDHDSIPFRSKLEAKWYAVFKLMGFEVDYEPGAHVVPYVGASYWDTIDERQVDPVDAYYLPDFMLNKSKFVEIKPLLKEYPARDIASIWKAICLGYAHPTIVILGEPREFVAFECNDRHKGNPQGSILNGNLEHEAEFWLNSHYPDENHEDEFPFEKIKIWKTKNEFALEAEKKIQWRPKKAKK